MYNTTSRAKKLSQILNGSGTYNETKTGLLASNEASTYIIPGIN